MCSAANCMRLLGRKARLLSLQTYLSESGSLSPLAPGDTHTVSSGSEEGIYRVAPVDKERAAIPVATYASPDRLVTTSESRRLTAQLREPDRCCSHDTIEPNRRELDLIGQVELEREKHEVVVGVL